LAAGLSVIVVDERQPFKKFLGNIYVLILYECYLFVKPFGLFFAFFYAKILKYKRMREVTHMALGEKLKKLRKEKGWSQQEVSSRLGVHQKHLSRYENNASKPSLDMLRKLGEIFNVSVDFLIDEGASAEPAIRDKELQTYFEKVDNLDEENKKVIKAVIDAILVKTEVKRIKTDQP
jgi:transcriptional regulator with XRE-family HTH domain